MRALRAFVTSIIWVEVFAVGGLLGAGTVLTWVEADYFHSATFFTYRIEHLDFLPAWFACTLALLAINGFWVFRLASVEGFFRTPRRGWGEWGASVPINPLRLFAINLVAIPAAIALFIVMRANCW
jgi:hypothetical protein